MMVIIRFHDVAESANWLFGELSRFQLNSMGFYAKDFKISRDYTFTVSAITSGLLEEQMHFNPKQLLPSEI